MIKQAILKDDRNIRKLISSSKISLNKVDKVKVGIMPWYGFNIEDGIVIRESVWLG